MRDISLHILDIVENSLRAESNLIEISIEISNISDELIIKIKDDGNGMNRTDLENVINPFFTTKNIKKVGLGIPLLKANAENSGGKFAIKSSINKGTYVISVFKISNIDTPPLGDINSTIITLIISNPDIDFIYKYKTDLGEYKLDTREIKEIIGNISIAETDIILYIKKEITHETKKIMEG